MSGLESALMPRGKKIGDRPLASAVLAIVVEQEKQRNGGRLSISQKLAAAKTAADVVDFVVGLAIAHVRGAGADGQWPNQVEYAAYWGITERTAQRRWALYRHVFGEDAEPRVLAKALVAEQAPRLADDDTALAVGWEASGELLSAVVA